MVDVLDRDGALVDACPARDAVPHDLVGHRARDEHRRLRPGQHPGPLGEQPVAQAHDQELRRQVLARRPRRADVLAAAALGARHGVDHLLPGHVGERPRAEPERSLVLDLEVEGLEAPARPRPPEPDVDRRCRDVQVLRVRQVDEEAEDREHVEPDEDALPHLEPVTGFHERRDRIRDGRPARGPLVDPEGDLRRVPEEQRRHDERDQAEDQVGLAEVAPLEPGRPLHLADQERRRHADEDEHAEHVDEEEEPPLMPEPGQRPVAIDRPEERHHDRREQDDEAPEDEGVHDAGDESLQKLPLAQDDRRLRLHATPDVPSAAGRLAQPDEAVEEVRAAQEEPAGDGDHESQRDRGDGRAHRSPPRRRCRVRLQSDTCARTSRDGATAAEIAGTISCRSPMTA